MVRGFEWSGLGTYCTPTLVLAAPALSHAKLCIQRGRFKAVQTLFPKMACNEKTISTVEEWKKHVENATESPLVMQVTASWCQRCPGVHDAIEALKNDHEFTWLVTDASDTELTEHFQVAQLPALVIYKSGMADLWIRQAVSVDAVNEAIKSMTKRLLVTDADF